MRLVRVTTILGSLKELIDIVITPTTTEVIGRLYIYIFQGFILPHPSTRCCCSYRLCGFSMIQPFYLFQELIPAIVYIFPYTPRFIDTFIFCTQPRISLAILNSQFPIPILYHKLSLVLSQLPVPSKNDTVNGRWQFTSSSTPWWARPPDAIGPRWLGGRLSCQIGWKILDVYR